jgi:hypothetical protein
MSEGSMNQKANHQAEFFGGPMDGHRMSLAVPAGNFVFVIGGITWDYVLASTGDLLRYELAKSPSSGQ